MPINSSSVCGARIHANPTCRQRDNRARTDPVDAGKSRGMLSSNDVPNCFPQPKTNCRFRVILSKTATSG